QVSQRNQAVRWPRAPRAIVCLLSASQAPLPTSLSRSTNGPQGARRNARSGRPSAFQAASCLGFASPVVLSYAVVRLSVAWYGRALQNHRGRAPSPAFLPPLARVQSAIWRRDATVLAGDRRVPGARSERPGEAVRAWVGVERAGPRPPGARPEFGGDLQH